LGCHKGELSILFTDDSHMEEMNRRYLGRKGPTNVLAFPMSDDSMTGMETGMLGDVVISVDTAVRESDKYREPLHVTVYRLLIHGILHLLHYDHERSLEDEKEMVKQERRLLSMIEEES
jgi:probable rRNA maturation factor